MRALVTGGTGFVGANLVAGLNASNINVRVLHRANSSMRALEGLHYEPVVGDVLDDPAELAHAMEGCEWVFHVAAIADYWRQGKEQLYRVNVEGTKRVLAAAQEAAVPRFVFTSSLAALGIPRQGQLLDEDSTFDLEPSQFPYGHSKHLAETEVRRAVKNGLQAIIVNPTVILGPRDLNQISGSIVLEAAKGRLRFLPPGGTNFVAVEDVVAGHIAAAENGQVGQRYILGAENLSYAQAIHTICDVIGRRPPRWKIPGWALPPAAIAVRSARFFFGNRIPLDEKQVRIMAANIYADSSKAVNELKLPQTSFRTAVQQTYNWYNECGFLD